MRFFLTQDGVGAVGLGGDVSDGMRNMLIFPKTSTLCGTAACPCIFMVGDHIQHPIVYSLDLWYVSPSQMSPTETTVLQIYKLVKSDVKFKKKEKKKLSRSDLVGKQSNGDKNITFQPRTVLEVVHGGSWCV